MIQRIQTLYLLAALILSAALFFIPLYSIETLNADSGTHDFHYADSTSNIIFLLLNSVIASLTLIVILLYKNRVLQVRLCNITMLITCIFIGTVFYFADHSDSGIVSTVHYDYGTYFPLVQLVLLFIAMRAIRKDEALVRSADRLR